MKWTGRAQEWMLDHGIHTDENGILLIPRSKWRKMSGTDTSLRNPQQKTICIPEDNGLSLFFEGIHFRITNG